MGFASRKLLLGGNIPATINWQSSSFPEGSYNYIAYGNGRFVCVTPLDNISAYSDDGITWTTVPMPTNFGFYPIVYGGNFIAFQTNSTSDSWCAISSNNGINWGLKYFPFSNLFPGVVAAYGNGRYVAISRTPKGEPPTVDAFYSSNSGENWTTVTFSTNGSYSSFADITYGFDKFVAVGANRIAYSSNGGSWSVITIPDPLSSVEYGNGKFVAIGSSYSYSSSDGINWIKNTMPSVDTSSLAYGDGKFIATGSNGLYTAYSNNGLSWGKADNTNLTDITSVGEIKYGNGKFVGTKGTGAIYTT